MHAQDRLYFVLSTKNDFPLGQSDAGVPIPLEEVELAPVIQYASCSGACGAITSTDNGAVDGTGAPLFRLTERRTSRSRAIR